MLGEQSTKSERNAVRRTRYEIGGGAAGALGGAGLGGLAAGPVGAAVGAVIGAGAGVLTAWAAYSGAEEEADRDSQLDIDIGVTGAELGAPNLQHPPAKIGAFSKEATGTGGTSVDDQEAAGPILPPPD